MFNILGRPKVAGLIGYYGLQDWWYSEFSKADRELMADVFKPLRVSTTNGSKSKDRELTEGIASSGESVVGFLATLSGWFSGPNRILAQKIVEKSHSLLNEHTDALERHFLFQSMIKAYYPDRTKPEALDKAIEACRLQIKYAPVTAQAWKNKFPGQLPMHKGYEQLVIT